MKHAAECLTYFNKNKPQLTINCTPPNQKEIETKRSNTEKIKKQKFKKGTIISHLEEKFNQVGSPTLANASQTRFCKKRFFSVENKKEIELFTQLKLSRKHSIAKNKSSSCSFSLANANVIKACKLPKISNGKEKNQINFNSHLSTICNLLLEDSNSFYSKMTLGAIQLLNA